MEEHCHVRNVRRSMEKQEMYTGALGWRRGAGGRWDARNEREGIEKQTMHNVAWGRGGDA